MDILRQLLEPSDPPQRAESHPFKTSLFFFYLYYALPPAIQFHLPSAYSLNTCAIAIPPLCKILKVSCSESKKIIPMPRPFTSFTKHTKNATNIVLGSLTHSSAQAVCLKPFSSLALLCYTADPNQCPYGSVSFVLFAYCYKQILTKKNSFSTSSNVVTLNWASILYYKNERTRLSALHI